MCAAIFFGRALTEQAGIRPGADYDEELMFLIFVLYDFGLAEIANGAQRFEMDGADFAVNFLEDTAAPMGEWISCGTGLPRIPPAQRVAGLPASASGGDLDRGVGHRDRRRGRSGRSASRDTPIGCTARIRDWAVPARSRRPSKRRPSRIRTSAAGHTFGEILRLRHPDLALPTWETILAPSGWGN